jgi:hypothetical protein
VLVRDSGKATRRLVLIVVLAFVAGAVVMYIGHHHVLEAIVGLFR